MNGNVIIRGKTFIEGYGWNVDCVVEFHGTRCGTEYVELPEDATDEKLKEAILVAYKA